ncbi:Fic family protein [Candidatus Pacearchaeota archaeon]|nr:Fic family protein [Candidatus Pacearchaeota archaeon]
MVYIYKKIISGKPYYYLRISKRKGERVITKDIAYLGGDPLSAKNAVLKISKYKSEIRKSYRRINLFFETEHYFNKAKKLKLRADEFMSNRITEVEAIKMHYLDTFIKKTLINKKELIKDFAINFAYNTTSIEGNTITLKEAQILLEEGRTPKDKTLREIYDIQNTEKVFIELLNKKQDISHELIESVHKKLMENVDKRIGYRTRDVRVFRSHFNSAPGSYVRIDMSLLLRWYEDNKNKLHPFVLASLFHHKFEKVHPFMDGNGRTGRMLMNIILMNNNYPPMIIYKKDRMMYLNALGSADKIGLTEIDKKYKKLVDFMIDEMTSSYWNLFL